MALGQAPLSVQQPDQRSFTPRPKGTWDTSADSSEKAGSVYRLSGHAQVEGPNLLVKADDITYNEDTGDLRAVGHVYYHNFERNEQLWADRVDYNTDAETGTFYAVSGQATTRIDARPGVLTTNNPFYFQGEWAERQGDHYILHNGFITNCKVPDPWWRLKGPKFDIEPGERAIAYRSIFWVRSIPIFFMPYFHKSLEKVQRKSGFLMPNLGNSSRRGFLFGVGYFWAINRSYDVTYRFTDYTARGTAHNIDFRGKPRPGTDYDAIIYGVQDTQGRETTAPPGETPAQAAARETGAKYSGVSVNIEGKSDLGDGWTARGRVAYISSFRFRQEWSESFNEAIGPEINSVGFLNKNWSNYTFNVVAQRFQNFQQSEIQITDPATNTSRFETDAVTIRKLPEAQLSSRERPLFKNLPVWYSFDSSAGLLYRAEPLFNQFNVLIDQFQTGSLMNRANFAPHVMTAFHWGGFHIAPRFGIQETFYSESQSLNQADTTAFQKPIYQVADASIVRSSRDFSVDLVFPTLERVFNKKTKLGDKLKHVVETRATYKYVTGIGDDFTRYIRFDSNDLVSNTNELQFSFTNRLYAKRRDAVQEIFTWQLWQARYFDPTFGGALVPGQSNLFLSTAELTPYAFLNEPRSTSPVVSLLRSNPIGGLGVEWRTDYDHRRGEIVNSTISVDYRWTKYFVSVGHNQVHTDPILNAPANQFRFHASVGDLNHRGWNAGVDGIYDAHQQVLQYATTQVTYNTDCCGLSVQWRRLAVGLRNENQFRVAFSVANIGSFGTLRRQDRIF